MSIMVLKADGAIKMSYNQVDLSSDTVSGVLQPDKGGTGINNGTNLLTIPATGTAALKGGTPIPGNVTQWSDANTVGDGGFSVLTITRKTGTPVSGNVTQWSDANTVSDGGFSVLSITRKTGTPVSGNVTQWSDADTVSDGGFAINDIARRSQNNTFTGTNIFGTGAAGGRVAVKAQSGSETALVVDTDASPTVDGAVFRYNGNNALRFFQTGLRHMVLYAAPFDNGSGLGNQLLLSHNNNSSTPAAGHIALRSLVGVLYSIWPDVSGNLRIGSDPTYANDTSGTVVGTQTSWHELKRDIEPHEDVADSLARIRAVPLYRFRFKNDSQRGDKQVRGIVAFDENKDAWYMMNNLHPNAIPALDEAAIIGELIGAVQELAERVEQVERRINRGTA